MYSKMPTEFFFQALDGQLLFCGSLLLGYLVAQVVRVPDPMGILSFFLNTLACIQHLLFSPKIIRNIRHTKNI